MIWVRAEQDVKEETACGCRIRNEGAGTHVGPGAVSMSRVAGGARASAWEIPAGPEEPEGR